MRDRSYMKFVKWIMIDAERLRKDPPKMIIFLEMPEEVIKFHEIIFRDGHPSGQRKIKETVDEIVANYHYKRIDSISTPGYNWLLVVWVKP